MATVFHRRLLAVNIGRRLKSYNYRVPPKPVRANGDIHVFKRINWEAINLFGPLRYKIGKTVDNAEHSDTINVKVNIRVCENGFKDINGPAMAYHCHTHEIVIKVWSPSAKVEKPSKPLPVIIKKVQSEVAASKFKNQNKYQLPTVSDKPVVRVYNDDAMSTLTDVLRKHSLTENCDVNWLSKNVLPDRNNPNTWPGVTRILQATMSDESLAVLEAWKQRMIEKLGLQGFDDFKNEMFRVGKNLHSCIEEYLSSDAQTVPTDKALALYWRSLSDVLPNVTDVEFMETHVTHPGLCYKGVVDCVAKYRGSLVLIEWKTALKPKPNIESTYDNPLQAVAYLGALRASNSLPNVKMDGALLVIANAGGSPAHVHYLNEERCRHYWSLWLDRLCKYYSPKYPYVNYNSLTN